MTETFVVPFFTKVPSVKYVRETSQFFDSESLLYELYEKIYMYAFGQTSPFFLLPACILYR